MEVREHGPVGMDGWGEQGTAALTLNNTSLIHSTLSNLTPCLSSSRMGSMALFLSLARYVIRRRSYSLSSWFQIQPSWRGPAGSGRAHISSSCSHTVMPSVTVLGTPRASSCSRRAISFCFVSSCEPDSRAEKYTLSAPR